MQPLISVIVPAYNAANYLALTLDSILGQSYPNHEVLVIDDGSTDGTAEVAAGYGDRIRYFSQAPSGGPSRPRNLGIEQARGDLVAIFDADDVMLAGKLADAASVLQGHPEADLLFTDFAAIDAEGDVIRPSFLSRYRDFRDQLRPGELPQVGLLGGRELYRQLIHANFIGTSSVVARRDALREAGGFDERMKNADDIDMWCRLAWHGRTFAFLDRVGHQYRIHASSLSRRDTRRKPSVIRFWEKQRRLPLTSAERDRVDWALKHVRINYARGLRNAGERSAAIAAYRSALAEGLSLPGVVGLMRSLVMRTGRS